LPSLHDVDIISSLLVSCCCWWWRLVKIGLTPKHDHNHRLFFVLKWANDGNFYHTREAECGWSKASLQRDLEHVLCAIMEGLDDELQWPGVDCRAELAQVYPIFHGCIEVGDVKEYQVVKFQETVKIRRLIYFCEVMLGR
jgi:hypothetical protein